MAAKFKNDEIVNSPCKIISVLPPNTEGKQFYVVSFDVKFTEVINKDIEEVLGEDKDICKEIAEEFIAAKKKNYGNFKAVRTASVQKGMIEVFKLHKTDKFSYDVIRAVLRLAVMDDFWSSNFLTLTAARKKCKNDLTKFENIYKIYKRQQQRPVGYNPI